MTASYQSNYFTSVQKSGDHIIARSQLLSTGWEAVATLTAAVDTFRIAAAKWDISRSPGGTGNGGRDVPALQGVEAYLGAGPALRAALEADGDVAYALVAECVKGVIQSETYLFRERGYGDAAALQAFWKKNAAGSCHLYSNLARSTRSWNEYVAGRTWNDNLFSRLKTATVTGCPAGAIDVRGSFCDSFHELMLHLVVTGGIVTACEGNFLRCPDTVCAETIANLSSLVGRRVADLTKGFVGGCIGGPGGCSHMADLLGHMVRTVAENRPEAAK